MIKAKQSKLKKRLIKLSIAAAILYLVADLRLVLLVPNTYLYFKNPSCFTSDTRDVQINVFPMITVGNDPVFVKIQDRSKKMLPSFDRSGDRSGVFFELGFAGKVNGKTEIKSLDWLYGMAGGLSGGRYKTRVLTLNDYIDFKTSGIYRLQFKCQDDGANKEELLNKFWVARLPANPVSVAIKQGCLSILLVLPEDSKREVGIKYIGYETGRLSTKILAGYYFKYNDEWLVKKSTDYKYNNSLAVSTKGIKRNCDYNEVMNILAGYKEKHLSSYRELIDIYLYSQMTRLCYWSDAGMDESSRKVSSLFEQVYPQLSDAQKDETKKGLKRSNELNSDDWLLKRISELNDMISKEKDEGKEKEFNEEIRILFL